MSSSGLLTSPRPIRVASVTISPARQSPEIFRELDPQKIVETADQLERRIGDRFPQAGLRLVAAELHQIAQEAVVRCRRIGRPHYLLRICSGLRICGIIGLVVLVSLNLRYHAELERFDTFVQTLEAGLASVFFIGATVAFLAGLETRGKRERALSALRELRAIAHIVDMHQLTKDPESLLKGNATASSPKRTLSEFELGRYLDYCSELLSLVSKIGAIYVQKFPDAVAVEAADQLTSLTNGLSRNIWQKIVILDRAVEPKTVRALTSPQNDI
jgi:hypothetical protein